MSNTAEAPAPQVLNLSAFRGNAVTVGLLRRLLGSGHLSHALLLDGPVGCGKRTLALALAKTLLCHAPSPEAEACGRCPSCQALAGGVHPDCLLLPDDRELPLLPVELIRDQLVAASMESALLGHGRIFIVPQVERLRHEAANALLKVLEEPPAQTRILMTSTKGDGLLATIRSRSQRFRLQPLDSRDLAGIFIARGLDGGQASAAAAQPAANLRSPLNREQQPPVAALVELIGGGYDAAALADLQERLNQESLAWAGGTPTARQRNCLRHWLDAAIEQQRRHLAADEVERTLANLEALMQARADLGVNISPRLVLEGLALGQR
ncbi:MAG: hypothetical protein EA402_09260 [Planctomycetota bacterium]|nr:MAG: hypothetical protein EA402_09260 [Planctomycetota bacterium]